MGLETGKQQGIRRAKMKEIKRQETILGIGETIGWERRWQRRGTASTKETNGKEG